MVSKSASSVAAISGNALASGSGFDCSFADVSLEPGASALRLMGSLPALAVCNPPLKYGCDPSRDSSVAISDGDITKSTQPALNALRGMPAYSAVSSCTKVIPPCSLIAFKPSVPSVPVPDRITPTA